MCPATDSGSQQLRKWHNDFEKEIWSFCSKTHRVPLDPKTMKNEGFTPQNMWVMTPKNEGCGFPWYLLFVAMAM